MAKEVNVKIVIDLTYTANREDYDIEEGETFEGAIKRIDGGELDEALTDLMDSFPAPAPGDTQQNYDVKFEIS